MPAFFKESNSDELVAAVKDLTATMQTLNLQVPEQLTVRVPSLENPPSDPEMELIIGTGAMSFIFSDETNAAYPTDQHINP